MYNQTISPDYWQIGCSFSCDPLGRAHYRQLERLKLSHLQNSNGSWDTYVSLTPIEIQEFSWWLQNVPRAKRSIRKPNPDVVLYTDASSYGWGAILNNMKANGHFSFKEKDFSINTKEPLAILYGLQSFLPELINKHILLHSDNTTAVSYIKEMGGY